MKEISAESLNKFFSNAFEMIDGKRYYRFRFEKEYKNDKGRWVFIGRSLPGDDLVRAYFKVVKGQAYIYAEEDGSTVRYHVDDLARQYFES